MPIKVGDTISLDSLNVGVGGQIDLTPDQPTPTGLIPIGTTIDLKELKRPPQVSPDQGATPPSPEGVSSLPEPDQVGDVWTRGLGIMQSQFAGMFHYYDTWATKLEGMLGIKRGEETVLGGD